jgi:prefoldin subunit 5
MSLISENNMLKAQIKHLEQHIEDLCSRMRDMKETIIELENQKVVLESDLREARYSIRD